MLNRVKISEITVNQLKTAGILFVLAAIVILIGNFIPNLVAILIFIILGLILILISIVFIVFVLTKMLELKPDASTPINTARFGLVFYMILMLVINIVVFFVYPGVATIVLAVIQAIAQLVGFIALNMAFKSFSELLAPSDKIDSPVFIIYGIYGVLELIMAIIAALVGSWGAIIAVAWIDLILSTIVMLGVGIVLILNAEKLLKSVKGAVIAPTTVSPDVPNAKYKTTPEEPEESIFCSHCGNKLSVSDAFCPKCGAKMK